MSDLLPRRLSVAALVLTLLLGILPLRTSAQCLGDCDDSGDVTVDEVLTLVYVALGQGPLSNCLDAADLNGDGQITVDEIIIALNQALLGCFDPGSCDDPRVRTSEPLCALDDAEFTCDFLVAANCLLPHPSSVFLTPDPTTPTGLRLNYVLEAMPANRNGLHIDPQEWNTLDGFSPGSVLIAVFPQGVDLEASRTAPIDGIERSLEADSPTVLLDTETGERVPHFVELDQQATKPETQVLFIRPGVRLHDARRYVFAIRNLVDPQGHAIQPERPFQILRDGLFTPVEAIKARREAFEDIFSTLESAGVARGDLLLAWDFVTASTESLTSRALAIRDQGLDANGPGAPPFEVTSVEENPDDNIFRRIRGTFTVPNFMTNPGPSQRGNPTIMNLDAEGIPRQNGTATAPFIVNIPHIAVEGDQVQPGRPVVYGHGLLGSHDEANAGHLRDFSNRVNFIFGATDWVGLSEEDFDTVMRFIPDLSGFRQMPDRLQQAFLNFILLGRLFISDDGFNSDPAFQLDGVPLIDTRELYYYGISQGGVEGGAYLALSPDTHRGVLGVGASNYSILLQRSVDFNQFQFVLNQWYPNEIDRAVLYPIIQQLWDRGEPQGYQPHLLEDPLPGTPVKKILMQIGVDDSQVPTIGSEIQARSLGIPAVAPSGRPVFGIAEREAPFDGSAYVPYDVGGRPAPLTNIPPARDNGVHEAVRRLPEAQAQIDAFLRPDGEVENFCPGPCVFENVPGVETE